MRQVRIIDCEVVTLSATPARPHLRCNGCGAVRDLGTLMGQIHGCATRGAWQLIPAVPPPVA